MKTCVNVVNCGWFCGFVHWNCDIDVVVLETAVEVVVVDSGIADEDVRSISGDLMLF